MNKYDVVIVGSGIGGLCAGALLALAGKKVLICEAHDKPGGVAHSFNRGGYTFESGPSLWSGLDRKETNNPLGQILNILGETTEIIKYNGWKVLFPEDEFDLEVGDLPFKKKVKDLRGDISLKEWELFIKEVEPLSRIINKMPLLTTSPENLNLKDIAGLFIKLLPDIKHTANLTKSFGKIADLQLNDPFLKNWVDLLCFLISGMSMYDTNSAAMATLFSEWFNPDAYLEYPKGGSDSIVKALIRGLKKNGGELVLKSKVKEVIFKDDLAAGVKLENGKDIIANYIVLNCDVWTTGELLPNFVKKKFKQNFFNAERCNSFLHMHIGFDATNLETLPIHTIWVDKWERGISSERNIAVFSIPSVLDPSMAPEGKHVLHGYTPANEPWEIWKGLDPKSKRYKELKKDRCNIFLTALRKIIPDIEDRIEIKMLGTPLTHKKFTNTFCGSYGPAISAKKNLFPGCKTPIKNLFLCGASTFPGIGIPAVAASGAYVTEAIIGKNNFTKLIN